MIENLKARIFITVATVVLGLMWVLPNFMEKAPSWWPSQHKIVYGLDIQGGLHLVMKVDVEGVLKEKSTRLAKNLANEMKKENIGFDRVEASPDSNVEVFVRLSNEAQSEPVVKYIEDNYATVLQAIDTTESFVRLRYVDPAITNYTSQTVEQSIEVIRNRVDGLGVAEPSISRQGDDRILVQLPGIKNTEQAKQLINTTARLDFRIVQEDVDMAAVSGWIADAEKAGGYQLGGEGGLKYNDYIKRLNADLKGKLPKDTILVFSKAPNAKKLETGKIPYIVAASTPLTGDLLEDAYVGRGQYGEPEVIFSFNVEGRRNFSELTGSNIKRQMAIVLDNVVQSAPVIQSKIDSPTARITLGAGNYQEALKEGQLIATALRAGALPATLEQLEERTVGPTLGADSIAKGKTAGLVGALLVVIFMLFYYKGLGVVANLALTLNILFLLAILTSLGATLTLPGVAGIVLTLGMAVDANVIIFERMREELRKGAGIKSVIRDGFGHAFSAIFDANITTAAVCVVLMYFGTGAVRGFAVTLIIGIVTSMFTAIFVSRTFLEIMVNKFNLQKLSL